MLRILLATLLIVKVSQSANILCLFPTPSISHQLIPLKLVKSLADRGHNVTLFTTDPFETNATNIELYSWKVAYQEWNANLNMAKIKETKMGTLAIIDNFVDTLMRTTALEMAHPAVSQLIASSRTFDVVIVESLAVTPFYAFAKHFNAPLIGVTTLDAPRMAHMAVGNFIHPIVYPHLLLPFGENLTFRQRVTSVVLEVILRFYTTTRTLIRFDAMIETYFGANMTKSEDLLKSIDFLMYNNHPVLGTVRPTVPASLALGFVHIEPTQPLPQDLEDYFRQSKNGVIYFSLGSNVKSSQLPKERIELFCEAFRQLDYDILWKWEIEELDNKPPNVKIVKWLPQQDILDQEKVKLFITQGGQQSFEEAIHHGVPLLVIPFLGDQYVNAQRVVRLKVGLTLDINTVTLEVLLASLKELLTNKTYESNMEKLSTLAKDQPMTSLESAVWWTEYVIRNRGAKHLHAKDKDLPFYQYYFLDVSAAGLGLLYLLVKIIQLSFKLLSKLLKSAKRKTE